ncbi:MAG: hypothetical protein QOH76_3461 [Thermoleophilaceae bacterium]|jgi:hypothetical protein|nr:hypothetical protein [Thermoleophilaceae bacterium]
MDIQTGPGLSPWKPGESDPGEVRRARRHRNLMFGVRYGVPAAIFLTGVVVFAVVSDREVALEIGAMFWGVAIAVFLLNFFFRMGVSGEVDRDREEEARAYFDAHGRWPDEGESATRR